MSTLGFVVTKNQIEQIRSVLTLDVMSAIDGIQSGENVEGHVLREGCISHMEFSKIEINETGDILIDYEETEGTLMIYYTDEVISTPIHKRFNVGPRDSIGLLMVTAPDSVWGDMDTIIVIHTDKKTNEGNATFYRAITNDDNAITDVIHLATVTF